MHPTHDELAGYVFGTLAEELADAVADHVESCPQCEDTVWELETASDDVIRLLRQPFVEHPFEKESECRRLVEVIEAIGCDPSLSGTSSKEGEEQELGTIREYQLLAELGRGGMGTVYKALHTKLKRVVALKILPAERMKHSHAVERFELEMEAVGRLTHPNIVTALDAGEHEGTHYLVMEYVDGLDLSKLVHCFRHIQFADACELIRQAAVGLQHAHEHNLVHRDVKPSNLMLTVHGQVKILDLGLARLHNGDRVELTSSRQIMGTLDYMAPEQVSDSHDVDIRADIYALGATLYELLTGQAPFGDKKHQAAINKLMALANEPLPSITEQCPDVPNKLCQALERMLSKKPHERFSTPAEVAEALKPFAAGSDLGRLLVQARQQMLEPADSSDRSRDEMENHFSSALVGTKSSTRSTVHPVTKLIRQARTKWLIVFGFALVAVLIAGGIVIRWATDKGELVISSAVPDVELIIKRNGSETDRLKLQRETRRIAVRSGSYEIILSDSHAVELCIDNDNFTLSRGGTEILQITRVPTGLVVPENTKSRTLQGHTATVQSVAFSPDGSVLASVDVWGNVMVREVRSGRCLRAVKGEYGLFHCVAFRPDGKVLALSGTTDAIRLWDVTTGQLRRTIRGKSTAVLTVAFHPTTSELFSTGVDGTVTVHNPETGQVLRTLDAGSDHLNCLAFSRDGSRMAHGDAKPRADVVIWDMHTETVLHNIDIGSNWTLSVALSPDGSLVACSRLEKISLYDVATGSLN